ncbi:MAG TPA: diaminopimelate decarboxylase [Burkholderiaceae bacterium]|jgi:diaminopimelate decarboxylase|nr:diaminopimelate decarboxylase [Burkholderiaceae bacterium]
MTGSDASAAPFARRAGILYCEDVALEELAQRFGTPLYVYSQRAILDAYRQYERALQGRPAMVCYAVKASSNLGVLDLLARAGSGFDIVSGGELARVIAAGGTPSRVVFSGVGKTEAEIEQALAAGILSFNVESEFELRDVARIASALGRRAPVSLRVNPHIDPGTHPYIATGLKSSKFGVSFEQALDLYRRACADAHLQVVGIGCHIGSQIAQAAPFEQAADRLLDLVEQLEREAISLRHLDFGGGLAIAYRDEAPPAIGQWVGAITRRVDARGHRDKMLLVEPGRSIVGPAGVLLTRVIGLKAGGERDFAIVDAAMNDQMRPALYDAWLDVQPATERARPERTLDIVGPVCESGDWLARERRLAIGPGDVLAMLSAGAYGMSMASNYNSRCRAAEVIVDGARACCVRRRETIENLMAGESLLP